MKPLITEISCISEGLSTRYRGKLDNGKLFYLEFRYGFLTVRESPTPTNSLRDTIKGEPVLEIDTDDENNHYLSGTEIEQQLSEIYHLTDDVRNQLRN